MRAGIQSFRGFELITCELEVFVTPGVLLAPQELVSLDIWHMIRPPPIKNRLCLFFSGQIMATSGHACISFILKVSFKFQLVFSCLQIVFIDPIYTG